MLLRFFFQAEDGRRVAQESRGLGDVYKGQDLRSSAQSQHRARTHIVVRAPLVPARAHTHAHT